MLQRTEEKQVDSKVVEVAAIAAGMFSALGSIAAAGESVDGSASAVTDDAGSHWKNASRREALR